MIVAWTRLSFFIIVNLLIIFHYKNIDNKIIFQSIVAIHILWVITTIFFIHQFYKLVCIVKDLHIKATEIRFKDESLSLDEVNALNKYLTSESREDGIAFLEMRNINYYPFRMYPYSKEQLNNLIKFASTTINV